MSHFGKAWRSLPEPTLMLVNKSRDWIFGIAGIAVGSVATFVESWILQGNLDHRYPFKIMSTPPPDYYAGVAITLSSFAPFVSVIAGIAFLVLLRKRKIIAGIVPLIICPFVYCVGLWYLVSSGPYKNQLDDLVNYDKTSAAMRHQEFYFNSINTLLFSVVVYLIFILLVFGIGQLQKTIKLS